MFDTPTCLLCWINVSCNFKTCNNSQIVKNEICVMIEICKKNLPLLSIDVGLLNVIICKFVHINFNRIGQHNNKIVNDSNIKILKIHKTHRYVFHVRTTISIIGTSMHNLCAFFNSNYFIQHLNSGIIMFANQANYF